MNLIAIAQELFRVVAVGCQRSAAIRVVVTVLGLAILVKLWFVTGALLGFGASKNVYVAHNLSGVVVYNDGSKVPVDMMLLKFFPTAGQGDKARAAPPVIARVNASNGCFDAKWVGSADASKAPASWKVVVLSGDQKPIGEAVVPGEYGDLEKTPLTLTLSNAPLEIKIRKPVARRK